MNTITAAPTDCADRTPAVDLLLFFRLAAARGIRLQVQDGSDSSGEARWADCPKDHLPSLSTPLAGTGEGPRYRIHPEDASRVRIPSSDSALPALNALARERLSEGIPLYIEATSDNEYISGPAWLRVDLSAPFIDSLLELRGACLAFKTRDMSMEGGPDTWPESESRPKYWRTNVDWLDFWITGESDGGNGVTSTYVRLNGLMSALNQAADAGRDYSGVVHYGGALIAAQDDTDEFIETLTTALPGLAAREAELLMQREIDARCTSQSQIPKAPAVPRAPRISM